MPNNSLLPKDPSDVGGVAARQGFKYQDHIAALLALDMLVDSNLLGVRCEFTDDIDLLWRHSNEYIQVKSTDDDKKWSFKEVSTTSAKNATDSILHKSLASDKTVGIVATFRIVTKRGVNSTLKNLTLNRSIRSNTQEQEKLIKQTLKSIKDFKSNNGNNGEYWVKNCLWEIVSSNDEAIGLSYKKIMKFAQLNGLALFSDDVDEIYDLVLKEVTNNGDKSNRLFTEIEKTCRQEHLKEWILKKFSDCLNRNKKFNKIYQSRPDSIFVELISLQAPSFNRTSHSFIVEYSRKRFRYNSIIQNLLTWLPEVLLMPTELANTTSKDAFKVWSNTIEKYKSIANQRNVRDIIGDIIFHIILRTSNNSEPIAGCLYINGKDDLKTFNNVHIVNNDELWMGITFIAENHELVKTHAEFADILTKNLDVDIFDKSRQRYLDLKDDNHLSKHNVDELLSAATTIEEHLNKFRFCVLIAYDSTVLSSGYIDEYKLHLIEEVKQHFEKICESLTNLNDDFINNIAVHVYLVPIESIQSIETLFLEELKG